jgi:alpha-1,6-mannosyltransferase
MRRSVHFTNAWHGASGGIRTFYEALLNGAERHRRHLALVVPGERTDVEHRGTFGRIYTLKASRSPVFDRRYRVLWPHQYLTGRQSPIERILAQERPEVIEICDKYVLPWLCGVIRTRAGNEPRPTLIGLSCERMDDNVRAYLGGGTVTRTASRAFLRRAYLPLFDAHIANSTYTAEELTDVIDRYAPVDERLRQLPTIRIGPMGVALDEFSPARRLEHLRDSLLGRTGGGTDARLIVYAGRLSPEKHVRWLPEMLDRLAGLGIDGRLVICGDGPLRAEMDLAAARMGRRMLILGHVDRATLADTLASADVFVHPNPNEPFGIGPLEAMASALPVVLPRSGGVLTYASDHNSWLTSASAEGLAAGVAAALLSPARAAERCDRALTDVQRLSWPAAVDTYFDHYDELDQARRARSWPPAADKLAAQQT